MEQTMSTMPAMGSGKQGNGMGLKIATTISSVVAICGIGFGIYGMMQSLPKDNQISDLKVQIKEDDGTITTLETEKIETTDNGAIVTIIDSATKSENTADHIYVGEWGYKIKIPEELNYVGYELKYGEATPDLKEGSSSLAIFATVGNSLSDFANMYVNDSPLGVINRIEKDAYGDADCLYSALVFSDESYNYCYMHPQDVYSIDADEQDLEVKTVDVIKQMLTNPDNYTEF